MTVVSLSLGAFWIGVSADYIFTGRVPGVVLAVDAHTNLIAALDLSMVVPFGLLGPFSCGTGGHGASSWQPSGT